MRTIAVFVLIIGIALAGGGAYYVSRYISEIEALATRPVKSVETMKILVARENIPYGHVIEGSEVTWAEFPVSSVPSGAYNDVNAFFGNQKGVFRTAIQAMTQGEPILGTKVTRLGERPSLAYNLSPGMRAFSFPISATSGVAGFVQAGNKVDILLTRLSGDSMRTEVLLQDVLVIAVDQRTEAETRRALVGRTATVEVTPIDAQKLTIAQTEGKLSMTLRGTNEPVTPAEELIPLDADELFEREKEEAAPEVKRNTVRLRRGGETKEVEID